LKPTLKEFFEILFMKTSKTLGCSHHGLIKISLVQVLLNNNCVNKRIASLANHSIFGAYAQNEECE